MRCSAAAVPTDRARPSIALAHDYLTQRGGAERVAAVIAEAFPGAPLYTSVYEPSQTFEDFVAVDVRTSWLQRVPLFRRDPRTALAFLAPAFSSFDVEADVVIASSSGWSHGIGTTAPVIVYCHAPARWLYQASRYAGSPSAGSGAFRSAARIASSLSGVPLRRWDAAQAARADRYLVNSTTVARQVADIYGIEAEVLAPPPALDPGGPSIPVPQLQEGFLLCVARLLPYKNVDVIIELARRRPERHLVIVGDGPLRSSLAADAPANVQFLSRPSDGELRWLYASASVLLAASYEDFGLTPLEAAAFGTPTVALRSGGYLDTIIDGETGALADAPEPELLLAALDRLEAERPATSLLTAHAASFGRERFIARLRAVVGELLSSS